MRLAICKRSALRCLRHVRRVNGRTWPLGRRSDLSSPDPSPYQRWSRKRVEAERQRVFGRDIPGETLDIAVPHECDRVALSLVRNTIYAQGLPEGAFVQVTPELCMSSPELLFVELAGELSPLDHLLLGYELCGAYALDPFDSRHGEARMGLAPVTSVRAIRTFLDRARGVRGSDKARETLRFLSDNAWSPAEAALAALLALPLERYGYGFGPCLLNGRIQTPAELAGTTNARSRVPDIMIPGTKVGINYDGAGHLDLGRISDAAREQTLYPQSAHAKRGLQESLDAVRGRAVDDIRRNRELTAQGLIVFPVVKEDLRAPHGLDHVVRQMLLSMDAPARARHAFLAELLDTSFAARERQMLVSTAFFGTPFRLQGERVEAVVRLRKRARVSSNLRA